MKTHQPQVDHAQQPNGHPLQQIFLHSPDTLPAEQAELAQLEQRAQDQDRETARLHGEAKTAGQTATAVEPDLTRQKAAYEEVRAELERLSHQHQEARDLEAAKSSAARDSEAAAAALRNRVVDKKAMIATLVPPPAQQIETTPVHDGLADAALRARGGTGPQQMPSALDLPVAGGPSETAAYPAEPRNGAHGGGR